MVSLRETARAEAAEAERLPSTSERRLVWAQRLFGLGAAESALALLDRFLEVAPPSAARRAALSQRFRYQTVLGRYHEALAALSTETELGAALCTRVADVLMRRDNPRRGLPYLDRAIALEPMLGALRLARVDAWAELGDWAAALAALREILHQPASVEAAARLALRIGAFAEAATLANGLLAREPLSSVAHEILGQLALFRGDLGGAKAHAATLLGIDPPTGFLLRGAARLLSDDLPGAETDLAEAGDGWPVRVWRGELLLRRGELRPAIEQFRSAAEAAPGLLVSAHLLQLLGNSRTLTERDRFEVGGLGAYGEVIDAIHSLCPDAASVLVSDDARQIGPLYERALKAMHGNRTISPSLMQDGQLVPLRIKPGPRYRARRLMNLCATAPHDEILDGLAEVIRDHPDSGLPRCYRAELLLWFGEYEEARVELEHIIERLPLTRWAYIGLATVEMLTGACARALDTLTVGIGRLNNTMGPPAYAVRGELFRRLGRLPEAIADLEKATTISPRRAAALLNLAIAYLVVGRDPEALHILTRMRAQAQPLFDDAGVDLDGKLDPTALQTTLDLLHGNRSSSGITWIVPGRPLRYLFFDPEQSQSPLAEIEAKELMLARNHMDHWRR